MSERPTVLTVVSDDSRLEFDRKTGEFSVFYRDAMVFERASARIFIWRKKIFEVLAATGKWEIAGNLDDGYLLECSQEWGRELVRVRGAEGALTFELGMVWDCEDPPPQVEAMAPLFVPPGGIWPECESIKSWRFYTNGWQCWTSSGVLKSDSPGDSQFPLFFPKFIKAMIANSSTPVDSEKGKFESEWFGALGDVEKGDSVLVGFVGVTHALSQVSVRLGRKQQESDLKAVAQFEGKTPEKGQEFWSEPLAIVPGDLSGSNLEKYADMVAREQGVGEIRRAPSGWCSWYQYFTDITQEKVENNLRLISERYKHLGIELVQIDDGYEPYVGDWLETNNDFPGGMKELARKITAAGRVAGIWIAPFAVLRRSKIFKEKKEWVLSDKRGNPVIAGMNPLWKGRYYGLDVTHPEVLDWLREVFTTIRENGYQFIKLDFLAAGLLEGKRHDPDLTRAEAARRALEVIRDTVGEDIYLLAAGGPILLGVGILDSQRVSSDVDPSWAPFWQKYLRDRSSPGLRNSLKNAHSRCFMRGRLFEADPDCMLARVKDSKLTRAEKESLASAIAVYGGAFMVSDDLGLWGKEEEEMVGSLLPQVAAKPFCPDLWLREQPRCMVSSLKDPGGEYYLCWIMNWSDREETIRVELKELGIDAGRYHAHEFWTGRYLGKVDNSFTLDGIGAHGSAVVKLTPVSDKPLLVGSSIHITQGAAELKDIRINGNVTSLSLTNLEKRDVAVTVAVPEAGEIAVQGLQDGVSVKKLEESIYRLEFELDRSRVLEFSWT